MEEVGAQLGFAQLVGGGTKMPGEARDHRDVRLDRPLGVAAKMEVIDQALAQGSHVILSGKGRRGSEQRLDARSTRRKPHDQDSTSIRRRRIEFNADWVEILSGEGWRILRDLAGEPDRTRSFSPLTLTGAPCWGEAFSAVNRKSCKRSQE